MTRSAFLDSGIFIAFLNPRDRWHAQARALFSTPPAAWTTSILVISETYSWFLHRMGEEAARTFRRFLGSVEDLRVLELTSGDHEGTWRILDRFRGAKLTYVDASSLHFLESQEIRTVWSTDYHLSLAGAEVLPRI